MILKNFFRLHRSWITDDFLFSINKHIWEELWLYHNIDKDRKKPIIFFWEFISPYLSNLESPRPKAALCWVWSKLAQRFLRRSRKCEKFTEGRRDRRRMTCDQKSSLKLSVQVSQKIYIGNFLWRNFRKHELFTVENGAKFRPPPTSINHVATTVKVIDIFCNQYKNLFAWYVWLL